MNKNSPIGIFDSGLGGLSVVRTIRELLPNENIVYFGDSANNPYGLKTKEQIREYSMNIVRRFDKEGVKAVVIACNTATSAAAELLRSTFDFDIVGMEPALKTGAEYKEHSRIAVWATPLTLQEDKFLNLMHRFEADHKIRKVACPNLVECVESGRLGDEEYVQKILQEYLDLSSPEDLDCIVLGCTHFVFFKEELKKLTNGRIAVIDGNEGTARRLKSLLESGDLLTERREKGWLVMHNSLNSANMKAAQLMQDLDQAKDRQQNL